MRRGFTFIEVLFAVMILGIGFIMIAGMFAVATRFVQQTETDLVGESDCRAGAQALQAAWWTSDAAFPSTHGQWWNLQQAGRNLNQPLGPDWLRLGMLQTVGTQVAANGEDAWIPFYSRPDPRDGASTPPQIIMVSIRVSGGDRSTYSAAQWQAFLGTSAAAPMGVAAENPNPPLRITIGNMARDEVSVYRVQIKSVTLPSASAAYVTQAKETAAGTGAYIITDGTSDSTRGQILQLGQRINADTWELAVNSELPLIDPDHIPGSGDETLNPAFVAGTVDAYLIGRGLADPSRPFQPQTNPYTGAPLPMRAFRFSLASR